MIKDIISGLRNVLACIFMIFVGINLWIAVSLVTDEYLAEEFYKTLKKI